MQAWTGVVLAAGVLLVVAAVPKLSHPGPTVTALRAVGLGWVGRREVLALTVLELASGAGAVLVGGRAVDASVAVLYLGFTAFLARALVVPSASCGCTARDDTPPSVSHLVMTAVFGAGSVVAAAVGGRTGLIAIVGTARPAVTVILVVLASLAAWLGWVVLTLPLGAQPRTAGRSASI